MDDTYCTLSNGNDIRVFLDDLFTPGIEGIYGYGIVGEYGQAYVDGAGFAHRVGGPAITVRYGRDLPVAFSRWYRHGHLHNLDGPAIVSGMFCEYWIRGKKYTKEVFEEIRKNVDEEHIYPITELGDLF